MSVKNRLDLVISDLGLSGRALERECGLTNGSYASLGDGVGADKLMKILARFPELSADWLITGKGEMYRQESVNIDALVKIQQETILNLSETIKNLTTK